MVLHIIKSLAPVTGHFSRRVLFVWRSLNYLEDLKKQHPLDYNDATFYALGEVLRIAINSSPTSVETDIDYLYKGDKCIYGEVL